MVRPLPGGYPRVLPDTKYPTAVTGLTRWQRSVPRHLGQLLATPTVAPPAGLVLGDIALTERPAVGRTRFQGVVQLQKGRMPLCQPVIYQLSMRPIVAVAIVKAFAHAHRLGIGVDITQGVQGVMVVVVGKAAAVITLLPKVPGTVEPAVATHGAVPVEPVHDAGQVSGRLGFEQVMDVIAYDTQGIEGKGVQTFDWVASANAALGGSRGCTRVKSGFVFLHSW